MKIICPNCNAENDLHVEYLIKANEEIVLPLIPHKYIECWYCGEYTDIENYE